MHPSDPITKSNVSMKVPFLMSPSDWCNHLKSHLSASEIVSMWLCWKWHICAVLSSWFQSRILCSKENRTKTFNKFLNRSMQGLAKVAIWWDKMFVEFYSDAVPFKECPLVFVASPFTTCSAFITCAVCSENFSLPSLFALTQCFSPAWKGWVSQNVFRHTRTLAPHWQKIMLLIVHGAHFSPLCACSFLLKSVDKEFKIMFLYTSSPIHTEITCCNTPILKHMPAKHHSTSLQSGVAAGCRGAPSTAHSGKVLWLSVRLVHLSWKTCKGAEKKWIKVKGHHYNKVFGFSLL